ncbi:hypothetical protein [Methylobacterium symbioticum]|jgi:hypothetical protein|uniref:Uncharacterized protein n=1 Tax=Methylobacterium symbioticum TaxID=2584084 RepID=A0A509EDQ8_9HYPH|nr:hypothetical protein [Methylobacterium symbioticum]VUD71333.1 hypothetical protein MET9862_01911 [Methylobacterium symbioticum]
MIRIVKHVIVETGAESDRHLERIEAAIRARFPEATTEVVQGLLDEDRVVEARLPLRQLADWRAERARLLRTDREIEVEAETRPETDGDPSSDV